MLYYSQGEKLQKCYYPLIRGVTKYDYLQWGVGTVPTGIVPTGTVPDRQYSSMALSHLRDYLIINF